MKSKKNILVALSVLIAIVFVLSLIGQQAKISKEEALTDYSKKIAGTWVGTTYYSPSGFEELISDYGPISITFSAPDSDGWGTYDADPLNPFYPERTIRAGDQGYLTLSGVYRIKADMLAGVMTDPEHTFKFWVVLDIKGNTMKWIAGTLRRGIYEKQ